MIYLLCCLQQWKEIENFLQYQHNSKIPLSTFVNCGSLIYHLWHKSINRHHCLCRMEFSMSWTFLDLPYPKSTIRRTFKVTSIWRKLNIFASEWIKISLPVACTYHHLNQCLYSKIQHLLCGRSARQID